MPQPGDLCSSTREAIANSAYQHPRPTKMLHALRQALIDSKSENEKLAAEIAALKEKSTSPDNSWEKEKEELINERDFFASSLKMTQDCFDTLVANFDSAKAREQLLQTNHEMVVKQLKETDDRVFLLEEQLREAKTEAEKAQHQLNAERENQLAAEITALKEELATKENSWEKEKMMFIKERDFIASKLNITQKSLDKLTENSDITKAGEKQMQNKYEGVAKTLKETEDQVLLLEEQLRKTKTEAEKIQSQMRAEREREITALKEKIATNENSWEKEKMALINEKDFIASTLKTTQDSFDSLVENFDTLKAREQQLNANFEVITKQLEEEHEQCIKLAEQLSQTTTRAEELYNNAQTNYVGFQEANVYFQNYVAQLNAEWQSKIVDIQSAAVAQLSAVQEYNNKMVANITQEACKDITSAKNEAMDMANKNFNCMKKVRNMETEIHQKETDWQAKADTLEETIRCERQEKEQLQNNKADMEEKWLAKEEEWTERYSVMEEHIHRLSVSNIKLRNLASMSDKEKAKMEKEKKKAKKEAENRLKKEMKEQKKREKKDNKEREKMEKKERKAKQKQEKKEKKEIK